MSSMETTSGAGGSRGVMIAFRVLAVLGGILFAGYQVFFVVQSVFELDGQAIHVVHNLAGLASNSMLAGVPMLLLVWRPRQVALLRLIAAATIGTLIGALLGGVLVSFLLIGVVIGVLLIALSPDRAEVFRLGSPNLLLLAVAFLCGIPAVVEALRQGDLQNGITTGDEHHEFLHYAGMCVAYLSLLIGAAWSAFPARAVRTARWLVGLGGAVLAVSFMAYPDAVSSVELSWAVGLLFASIVYLALAEVASRSAAPTT
jgi:hypothetical protein